jgi:hypothetical protein
MAAYSVELAILDHKQASQLNNYIKYMLVLSSVGFLVYYLHFKTTKIILQTGNFVNYVRQWHIKVNSDSNLILKKTKQEHPSCYEFLNNPLCAITMRPVEELILLTKFNMSQKLQVNVCCFLNENTRMTYLLTFIFTHILQALHVEPSSFYFTHTQQQRLN